MIWGFRQFRILPQKVSRVKSKIELNIENKTVIVLNKIILPIELDIYV